MISLAQLWPLLVFLCVMGAVAIMVAWVLERASQRRRNENLARALDNRHDLRPWGNDEVVR